MSFAVATESGQGKIALANGQAQLDHLKAALQSLEIAEKDIEMKAEFSNGSAEATKDQGASSAQETELEGENQKMTAFTNAAVEGASQGMGMREGNKADSFSKQEDFGRKAFAEIPAAPKPGAVDLKKNIGDAAPHIAGEPVEAILKGEKNALARPYHKEDPTALMAKCKALFGKPKNPSEQEELDALKESYLKLPLEQQAEFRQKLKEGFKKAGKTADQHTHARDGYIAAAQRYQQMAGAVIAWQYKDQIAAQQIQTASEKANQDQWSQLAGQDHSYDQATQQFSALLQTMRELATVERTAGDQNQARG